VITTDEGDNLNSTAGIQLARNLEEQESGAFIRKLSRRSVLYMKVDLPMETSRFGTS